MFSSHLRSWERIVLRKRKNSSVDWGVAQGDGVSGAGFLHFTFIHLADAFIQSDFQERALQKCIGHLS